MIKLSILLFTASTMWGCVAQTRCVLPAGTPAGTYEVDQRGAARVVHPVARRVAAPRQRIAPKKMTLFERVFQEAGRHGMVMLDIDGDGIADVLAGCRRASDTGTASIDASKVELKQSVRGYVTDDWCAATFVERSGTAVVSIQGTAINGSFSATSSENAALSRSGGMQFLTPPYNSASICVVARLSMFRAGCMISR